MSNKEELMPKVNDLLRQLGTPALHLAQKIVAQQEPEFAPLKKALTYFMEEIWIDILHPTLLSLASEAVGGNPQDTTHLGAALVLLAGGADIHDDIIDQSETKEGKPTVFGKFGRDLAILAGDALLFEGLFLLHEAVEVLPKEEARKILETIKMAFWGISGAEAKEASYRGLIDLSGPEYYGLIQKKVAVAKATTKIGAIIGGGSSKEIEKLTEFGQVFGILNTVRDEYIDVFEADELKNRNEKECLPLPILFAFKDPQRKDRLLHLLKQPLDEKNMEEILDLTMDSQETLKLTKTLKDLVAHEIQQLASEKKSREKLQLLLNATVENL
jgi:geranylgeranyl pyrophosphate synthase